VAKSGIAPISVVDTPVRATDNTSTGLRPHLSPSAPRTMGSSYLRWGCERLAVTA
jgi:hypothetical protein